MQQGYLLAHHTSTVAGVACTANALHALCFFKQRKGPFLWLAANTHAALKWARYISPLLRQQLKHGWPEHTTLIFPARKGLDHRVYQVGTIAVRVDANPDCQWLAQYLGGGFISSSLNRRGKEGRLPSFQLNWRWQRFGIRSDSQQWAQTTTQASRLLSIKPQGLQRLR